MGEVISGLVSAIWWSWVVEFIYTVQCMPSNLLQYLEAEFEAKFPTYEDREELVSLCFQTEE